MNIGIILDGVLTNLEQFQFDYGSKFYFGQETILRNPRGYRVEEIFYKHGNALQEARCQDFWDIYYEYYLSEEKPRAFTAEVLKSLKEHGFRIYLFCTRIYSSKLEPEKIKRLTKLWLIRHGIYFDFLIFSDIINIDLIKKYNIDLFVDHNPKTIFQLSMYIPVVCFHAKYNELARGENVYRVYSWYDFYTKLDEIYQTELTVSR